MQNKFKVFILLFKAQIKNWKINIIIFLTFLIPLITLTQYFVSIEKPIDEMYEKGVKKYGKYDFVINCLDKKKLNTIKNNESIKDYTVEYLEVVNNKNIDDVYFVYIDENYFRLTGGEVFQGEFPKSENEIICSSSFLDRYGIKFNKNKKIQIDISGIEYTVTGIVKNKDRVIKNSSYVFLNIDTEKTVNNSYYSIYIDTGLKNNISIRKECIEKYDLEDINISNNIPLMDYLSVNDEFEHTDIRGYAEKYAYFFVFIVSIFLTHIILRLCEYYNDKTVEILKNLGISRLLMQKVYLSTYLSIMFLTSIITFMICRMGCSEYTLKILKLEFLYLVVLIISILIWKVVWFLKNKKSVRKKSKKYEKIIPKIRLTKKKGMYKSISRQNIRFHNGRYIFAIIAIVINVSFFSGINYYFSLIEFTYMDTSYDYKITIKDTKANLNLESILKKASNDFDFYKMYDTTINVKIKKDSLNKEYVEFLKKEKMDLMEFENEYNEKTNIYINLITFDSYKDFNKVLGVKDYKGFKNNDIIISNNVRDYLGNKIDTKISKEKLEYTKYNITDEDEVFEIKPEHEFSYSNYRILNNRSYPVLVVPKDYYIQITENSLPTYIFADRIGNGNIYETFSGIYEVEITDLGKVKDEINSLNGIMNSSIGTIKIITVVYILVFILLIFIFNLIMFRKVFSYLFAIGFNKYKISKIYLYDNIYIISRGMIFSFFISILITKIINAYIGLYLNMKYNIPWELIFKSLFESYIVIFAVMILVFILSLKTISIKEVAEE